MESLSNLLQPHKELVGTVAGIVTIAQFFSGAVMCKDIYKSKSTVGTPSMPFIGGIVIGTLMLKYSIMLADKATIVVNLAAIILNALYLSFYYAYSENRPVEIYKPLSYGVALVAVLLAYTSWEDPTVVEYRYSIITTVLLLLLIGSPLFQVSDIVKTKDASCIPFPITFMGTICSSLWLLYAIILLNHFMILQNVVGLVLSVIQLVLCFKYPKRDHQKQS
ncbi:hypothetical protein PPYR_11199 [Photinus pyralis]|uniref:Sugar transporter SWEET n=1 Tax=Photinus pyralis TaxID=7054 RepID=A0A1Y1LRR4_PHOPY|nr:sugar transporter SWEET1 [Photinus pyralis]KAB0794360.1 hypothetical protein PPYR_11199 [Photinus pyralis]